MEDRRPTLGRQEDRRTGVTMRATGKARMVRFAEGYAFLLAREIVVG